MDNTPLVTIYMPTFNRVEILKRAVDSVLKQTYANFELIVVDDCSTDNTIEYLEDISEKDSRIRFYQNEKNSGACVSRNKAIEEAKGEYITGLDDDDYFLPRRIESFIEAFKVRSNIVGLYSNREIILNSQKKIRTKFNIVINKARQLPENIIGNQIFTKTETLRLIGGFDPEMPMMQDFECWFRLLKLGDVGCVYEPTYVVDMSHEHERITINGRKEEKLASALDKIIKKNNFNKQEIFLIKCHFYHYGFQLDFYKRLFFSILYFNKDSLSICIKAKLKNIYFKLFYPKSNTGIGNK